MQEHDWELIERVAKREDHRKLLTDFERDFIDNLHRRGFRARLSYKQGAVLARIQSKVPIDPRDLEFEYNSALAMLKQTRKPEDLRARMDRVMNVRAQMLKTLHEDAVPVVTHNLAETLYFTLLKEIKP